MESARRAVGRSPDGLHKMSTGSSQPDLHAAASMHRCCSEDAADEVRPAVQLSRDQASRRRPAAAADRFCHPGWPPGARSPSASPSPMSTRGEHTFATTVPTAGPFDDVTILLPRRPPHRSTTPPRDRRRPPPPPLRRPRPPLPPLRRRPPRRRAGVDLGRYEAMRSDRDVDATQLPRPNEPSAPWARRPPWLSRIVVGRRGRAHAPRRSRGHRPRLQSFSSRFRAGPPPRQRGPHRRSLLRCSSRHWTSPTRWQREPTVPSTRRSGNAMEALGYDRDFEQIESRPLRMADLGPVAGFRHLHLDHTRGRHGFRRAFASTSDHRPRPSSPTGPPPASQTSSVRGRSSASGATLRSPGSHRPRDGPSASPWTPRRGLTTSTRSLPSVRAAWPARARRYGPGRWGASRCITSSTRPPAAARARIGAWSLLSAPVASMPTPCPPPRWSGVIRLSSDYARSIRQFGCCATTARSSRSADGPRHEQS